MPETITLVGTESVEQAARNMQAAAESFRQTVGWLSEELARSRMALEENNQLLTQLLAEQGGGDDA